MTGRITPSVRGRAIALVAFWLALAALTMSVAVSLPARAQGTFGSRGEVTPGWVKPGGVATAPGAVAPGGVAPGGLVPGGAQGMPGGAVMMIRPGMLALAGTPRTAEVWVEGAPPSSGFQFELTYDPGLVAVTAIDAGEWLSSTGGAALPTSRFTDAGTLVVSGVVTLPEGMPAPEGTGALAYVTLVPLAPGGPAAIGLGAATLVGPTGDEIPVDRTVPGVVTVSAAAPEPALGEAIAQATALGDALKVGGGLWPELPDVKAYGAELVWLGLLGLAMAVVVVGWVVGRKPPSDLR